jgi:hypothetical protein
MPEHDSIPRPHAPRDLNPQVAHEPGDANARSVAKFGVALAVLIAVSAGVIYLAYSFLISRDSLRGPTPPPLAGERPREPRPPRLQASPTMDLRAMRREEDAILEGYGWVDREKGIARIPIAGAMDLLAARAASGKLRPAAPPSPKGPKR